MEGDVAAKQIFLGCGGMEVERSGVVFAKEKKDIVLVVECCDNLVSTTLRFSSDSNCSLLSL